MKPFHLIVLSTTIALALIAITEPAPAIPADTGIVPKDGYVPSKTVAIAISEAVLTPIFGSRMVKAERPYTARLRGGIWYVEGTFHIPPGKSISEFKGGVAEVKISKRDGRILYAGHGK